MKKISGVIRVLLFVAIGANYCLCQNTQSVNRNSSSITARPNILWISAEDISPDLGCYGGHLCKNAHSGPVGWAGDAVRKRLRDSPGVRAESLRDHNGDVPHHHRVNAHALQGSAATLCQSIH